MFYFEDKMKGRADRPTCHNDGDSSVCLPDGAPTKAKCLDGTYLTCRRATIAQVAIWLLLVAIKTLDRIRQMVRGAEKKPGNATKRPRVK